MLADDLVERYSRQILLPEVGGRGQERLLAATVVVTGDDAAATVAATLLSAAGVQVRVTPGPTGTLRIALGDGTEIHARTAGATGVVATLVAHPCPGGTDPRALARPQEDTPAARAVGALAAAEALRALLGLATRGRVHRIDLARGTFAGGALDDAGHCPACGPRA